MIISFLPVTPNMTPNNVGPTSVYWQNITYILIYRVSSLLVLFQCPGVKSTLSVKGDGNTPDFNVASIVCYFILK